MPALSTHDKDNFETMLRAARDGALCLLDCKDAKTGAQVPTICMVNRDGDSFDLVPVARMFAGDPYDDVLPPGKGND